MSLVETDTIFGRLVTGYDVEQWVLALLRRWSGTYLAEAERQHGYPAGHFQRVRGWALGPTFDKWPEDQLPGVLVVSPGIVPPPVRDGASVYRARWRINIGCCCSARTQEKSRELAHLYVAAHAGIIAQRPSLEGHAEASTWVALDYTALDYDDTRSLYAGEAGFVVEVDDVLTTWAGPATPDEPLEPDTTPWPAWPVVLTHEERVEALPPDQELPKEEG